MDSSARNEEPLKLAEALFELDRYRRGFQNLERQVRILDRERQKLAVVLNHAQVGFLILDRHLRLTWANPMVATSRGHAAGTNPAGMACHEVLCAGSGPCETCPARRALGGASPSYSELKTESGGVFRSWYVSAAQIRSPAGDSEEVLVMIQDLTDVDELRRSEASWSRQKQILEMIACDAPLEQVLEAICLRVEAESPDMVCAINTLDPESIRLRAGASPSLPESYVGMVDGLLVEEGVGACGTAAFRKEQVVIEDLSTHPYFAPARDYFAGLGLRTCWSTPIIGAAGRVLGTLALYFRESRRPTSRQEELVEAFAYLCRIAMERDTSAIERVRLEEQLRQSQKMEAIGTLAGGVAHDFNNLMTGVLGYVSMLRQSPSDPVRVLKAAGVIENAARRAAELTANLLGFARKGRYQSVPVNMNEVLEEVAALLGRTIDRRIELVVERPVEEPWIQGDPAQMHQVLLNLTVNARDAMPDGGRLTLFARVVHHPGARPPATVVVGVSDSGAGIPMDIRGRVFEPFFTTKETGRGSGMGLATAYGIVHNHGGELTFDSGPRGTTFQFSLPRLDRIPARAPAPSPQAPVDGADEAPARGPRILVIDDEAAVRDVCSEILGELGYEVLVAADGLEGIEVFQREQGRIDLVLLDMIMPRLGGRDCFRELKSLNPDVRAILVTGYSRDETARQLLAEGMLGFLQKPFDVQQLASLVSGALSPRA